MKLLVIFLIPYILYANMALIEEMEELRDSLPLKDKARPTMTLRLADLYFKEARNKEKDFLLKGQGSQRIIDKRRKRAIQLYKEALSGHNGVFPLPKGELKLKIHFQLARLYHRSGAMKASIKHYKEVTQSDLVITDIKKESHLGLAEIYENTQRLKLSDKNYVRARELCYGTGDTCSYIDYKRSWILYKDMRLEEAIVEIRKSLFDSKGQVKERSLQDYLLFLSNRDTDGIEEITLMEKLQERTGKDHLMRDLMEGYFSVGNGKAALNFLSILDRKNPNLYDQLRMAEELFGFKMWDRLDSVLSQLEEYKSIPDSLTGEQKNQSLKIFERLIVQLDAQREADTQHASFLLRAIMSFLSIFPETENRNKMMQGWLTAQQDMEKKILQLKKWIASDIQLGHEKTAVDFRIMRLSLAGESGDDEAFLEESLALSEYYAKSDKNKMREYAYAYAYKKYQLKDYTTALSYFNDLSRLQEEAPDKWSIQSQHLSLDIYSQKKDYRSLIKKVDTWLEQKGEWEESGLQKEFETLVKIKKQAQFELGAQLGTQQEALEIFSHFCLNGEFKEKSCTNAKVLAVKLKDQQKLVSILEHLKDNKALLAEYELMGAFHLAAPLYEKLVLGKKKSIEHYLKTTLLYELALNKDQGHRQIVSLVKYIETTKKMPKDIEPVIYRLIKEADLLENRLLTTIPWSPSMKLSIARELEAMGKGNKIVHQILVKPKQTTGPYWAKFYLKNIEKLWRKQATISFYGKRSKRLFNRRLKALERFKTEVTKVSKGAGAATRIIIFDMAQRAYRTFADLIEATPIPEGLAEEQLIAVKSNLEQMASPFREESKNYAKLQEEQLAKLEENEALALVDSLAKTQQDFHLLVQDQPKLEQMVVQTFPETQYKDMLSKLKDRPTDIAILEGVQNFLKDNKQERMAAYFTGRIASLQSKGNEL